MTKQKRSCPCASFMRHNNMDTYERAAALLGLGKKTDIFTNKPLQNVWSGIFGGGGGFTNKSLYKEDNRYRELSSSCVQHFIGAELVVTYK